MIEWIRARLEDLVLEPQADPGVDEARRVYLDEEDRPIDVEAQEIDVLAVSTEPLSYEIGEGLELRHTISVYVGVQHGDPVEARRRRGLIVTDLVLRALDARPQLMAAVDEDSGQYPTRLDWSVAYPPTDADTTSTAVLTFVIDAQLDR